MLYKVIFFKLEVQSLVPANILQNILVISEKKFRVKKVRKKCSAELFGGIGPKYPLNFTFCHFYENHPFYNFSQIFIAFRIKNKEVCKKKFENRPNGSKVMARWVSRKRADRQFSTPFFAINRKRVKNFKKRKMVHLSIFSKQWCPKKEFWNRITGSKVMADNRSGISA